jgi:hypothetical protein
LIVSYQKPTNETCTPQTDKLLLHAVAAVVAAQSVRMLLATQQ